MNNGDLALLPRDGQLAVAVTTAGQIKSAFGNDDTKAMTSLYLQDTWDAAKSVGNTCGEAGIALRVASIALPGPLKLPLIAGASIASGTGLAINATAASGLAVYGSLLNAMDDLVHFLKGRNGVKGGWQ